jgi:hypothetical protein
LDEARRLLQPLGADFFMMLVLAGLAVLAQREARRADERQLWREARQVGEALGERMNTALTCCNLGLLEHAEGNHLLAMREYRYGLTLGREVGTTSLLSLCQAGLAGCLTALGEPEQAARLLGSSQAAASVNAAFGFTQELFGRAYEPALAATQAALSAEEFSLAWAVGQARSLEQATAEALALADLAGAEAVEPAASG